MGDRARVILHSGDHDETSPTVYLHWGGVDVPTRIAELAELMATRKNDVSYAAARFIGLCHVDNPSNLSLGVFETDARAAQAIKDRDTKAIENWAEQSWLDAGLVVINVADFSWYAVGGYLADEHPATEKAA